MYSIRVLETPFTTVRAWIDGESGFLATPIWIVGKFWYISKTSFILINTRYVGYQMKALDVRNPINALILHFLPCGCHAHLPRPFLAYHAPLFSHRFTNNTHVRYQTRAFGEIQQDTRYKGRSPPIYIATPNPFTTQTVLSHAHQMDKRGSGTVINLSKKGITIVSVNESFCIKIKYIP